MSVKVSDDGVVWYEVDEDLFRTMVADESVNFWIDLSSERLGVCHVDATLFRAMLEPSTHQPNTWTDETTLYGVPIVFTEGVPE